ncbi:MAG: hypothetical protein ACE5KM_16550 [Planctomycetaceae bacterium]
MDQAEVLQLAVQVLERLGIDYLLVGSIASGAYGEPRLTQDIDIVVDLKSDQVSSLCSAFPAPEFYVNERAARQAVRDRRSFNVIHPATANKIDFLIARDDAWGREQLARRRRIQILPGQDGFAARPEDVILGKLLYYTEGGSEKHLRDITGMLSVSPGIDREEIARWAEQLGVADNWQTILDRLQE